MLLSMGFAPEVLQLPSGEMIPETADIGRFIAEQSPDAFPEGKSSEAFEMALAANAYPLLFPCCMLCSYPEEVTDAILRGELPDTYHGNLADLPPYSDACPSFIEVYQSCILMQFGWFDRVFRKWVLKVQIEIHLRYIDDIWRYGHIWPMIKGVLRCFASLQPYCGRGLKFLNTLHTHIPVCSKHVYTPFCNWCLFFSAWKDKSTPMFMAEVRLFIVFFGGLASGIHNYPYEFPPFNQLQDLLKTLQHWESRLDGPFFGGERPHFGEFMFFTVLDALNDSDPAMASKVPLSHGVHLLRA